MPEYSHAVTFADPGLTRRQLLSRAGLSVLALGLAPVVAACGGARARSSTSTAAGTVIEMNDQNRFVPEKVTLRVGDTVTWRNVGSVAHTVTGDPSKAMQESSVRLPAGAKPWDSGYIAGGQSWSRKFDTPGEYTYFCIPHEAMGMVASLTVSP